MPLTDSLVEVAQYLEGLLETNKGALGIMDVYYGDQRRIPRTPTACVDPGEKRSELNGLPRRTSIQFVNYVLIYHNPVTNVETLARQTDLLAEAVEGLIHSDAQMAGLAIDSLVSNIEYGYMARGNSLYRVSRLTVESRSQVQLPSSV